MEEGLGETGRGTEVGDLGDLGVASWVGVVKWVGVVGVRGITKFASRSRTLSWLACPLAFFASFKLKACGRSGRSSPGVFCAPLGAGTVLAFPPSDT